MSYRRPDARQVLFIDEILRLVARQLTMDHVTLAALARTCRACLPVAVKELWRVISSKQLIRILTLMVRLLLLCNETLLTLL